MTYPRKKHVADKTIHMIIYVFIPYSLKVYIYDYFKLKKDPWSVGLFKHISAGLIIGAKIAKITDYLC